MKKNISLYLPVALSLLLFVFLMFSSTVKPYGYFIDELYFIACSKRLAFGYIDQPPLSIALLSAIRWLFGTNITAIRLLPALSMGATVFLTALVARRLGGGLPSMVIASLAVMVMPVFLLFGSFYSMNAFEPLICTAVVYYIIRLIQEEDSRYWIHIGILTGIGLEMKHTFILYTFAFLAGFLLTRQRRLLFSRWLLWGIFAGFLVILPNLVWQVMNHFPSLELYRNSFTTKNIDKTVVQVFIDQVVFANPATFPLWITGLISLLFQRGRTFRLFLVAYIILLSVLMIGHSSRPDRIASVYPILMALGAVVFGKGSKFPWNRIILIFSVILIIAGGVLLTPLFCPVLPPESLRTYNARLGLKFDIEAGKKGEPIPQWLADRIGWPGLAMEVSRVYHALPADERQNAVIVSSNYGPAGALELYGPEYGLPAVYATHNSFHTWGPPSDSVRTYIAVFVNREDVEPLFDAVEEVSAYSCPDCTKPQQLVPIYILRGPRFSIQKEWPGFGIYQ